MNILSDFYATNFISKNFLYANVEHLNTLYLNYKYVTNVHSYISIVNMCKFDLLHSNSLSKEVLKILITSL